MVVTSQIQQNLRVPLGEPYLQRSGIHQVKFDVEPLDTRLLV
jgi:hypothetical protein